MPLVVTYTMNFHPANTQSKLPFKMSHAIHCEMNLDFRDIRI